MPRSFRALYVHHLNNGHLILGMVTDLYIDKFKFMVCITEFGNKYF